MLNNIISSCLPTSALLFYFSVTVCILLTLSLICYLLKSLATQRAIIIYIYNIISKIVIVEMVMECKRGKFKEGNLGVLTINVIHTIMSSDKWILHFYSFFFFLIFVGQARIHCCLDYGTLK